MAIVRSRRIGRHLRSISWPLFIWSMVAGGIGGLTGWAVSEPFVGSNVQSTLALYLNNLLYFGLFGAALGALIGAIPGLLNRSRRQALHGARRGLLVGGLGAALGSVPAQYIYSAINGGENVDNTLGIDLVARAVGWSILGGFVGLCPGVATRDRRRAIRGVLGGVLGGFLGGIFFNLVLAFIPRAESDTGTASRFIAELILGLCVGLLIAMVETVSKRAWLTTLNGRREGAQFILSKDQTLIGCDDRDDVILWGDPLLATHHARLERTSTGFRLDSPTPEAQTLVNGQPVHSSVGLQHGDEIMLGQTRLRFETRGAPEAVPLAQPTPSTLNPGPRAFTPATVPSRPSSLPAQPVQAVPWPELRPQSYSGGTSVAARPERTVAGLRLIDLAAPWKSYPLHPGVALTVGRSADNAIVLDDSAVSSHHARLYEEDGHWVIHDLGSTNGTYVSYGGAATPARRIAQNALKEGSEIRIGESRFRVEQGGSHH